MRTEDARRAARMIREARCAIAFTGAGISLESGVPTFRGGADSVWSKHDPEDIEIGRFTANPAKSWRTIKECFYSFMRNNDIRPNKAHHVLARMEADGLIKSVVTQNIDCLHQMAGSKNVIEFHGTTGTASCMACGLKEPAAELDMTADVPRCPQCGGLMKPDFVFFGEAIPTEAYELSMDYANDKADLCLVVGTTGSVMPAAMVPILVKRRGGAVIEVNPEPSELTRYADVFLQAGAVEAFTALERELWPGCATQ